MISNYSNSSDTKEKGGRKKIANCEKKSVAVAKLSAYVSSSFLSARFPGVRKIADIFQGREIHPQRVSIRLLQGSRWPIARVGLPPLSVDQSRTASTCAGRLVPLGICLTSCAKAAGLFVKISRRELDVICRETFKFIRFDTWHVNFSSITKILVIYLTEVAGRENCYESDLICTCRGWFCICNEIFICW